MFFKNMIVYRINRNFRIMDTALFEQQLTEFGFTPCGSQDRQKFGWTQPMGKHGKMLHHTVGANILICAKKEEKVIPRIVIKERLDEAVRFIENEKGRPLKKREKDDLKHDIVIDLLPHAFAKSSLTQVLIMQDLGVIVVNSSNARKAEDSLALLRNSVGSLPVVPVMINQFVNEVMTNWVKSGTTPQGITLLNSAEFESVNGDKSVVKCRNQELHTDEMITHIESNKTVVKLALDWQDRINFTLTEDLYFKGVKYSDELRDQNDDIPREDCASRFDADMALMCGEFSAMLPNVFDMFGGVVE